MTEVARRSGAERREELTSGKGLLVCASAGDEKFGRDHRAGAISRADLPARIDPLPKAWEIIFSRN